MDISISVLVKTFVAVFVLADAIGNIPILLVLTKGMEPAKRNKVIDKAILVAIGVLLLFAFAGQLILNYLDVSFGSLRVAGGLLLLLISLQMLRGESNTPIIDQEQERDVAITPLALPLLAGPGTLTSVMLLISEAANPNLSVVLGILAAMFISWLILRLANSIDKFIGAEGEVIITQLLGFLLAALAVEIGSKGIKELFF